MKKLKLFLAAALMLCSAGAWAQTDVTSTYITNAGFDESGDFQTANVATGGSNQRKAVTGWTNTGGDTYTTGAAIGFGTSGQINGANLPSTNSDGTATGGALCLNAAWQSQVWYAQEVTLPAGNYTMTFKVNNVGKNASFEKDPVMFSFTTTDGSSFSGNVHSYPVNTWTTQTITFALASETTGTIKVGYKAGNTGSGNTPKLVVDNVKAMYNSNYTATLQSAIDRATILNARASDDDLTAAITTAQSVLDAADNTVAYQATINSAVTTLRSAISTAAAKVVLLEGENVTFMFENADFESGTPVTVGITTYDYDAATNETHYSRMQVVEGWTIAANGNAKSAGIYQFGQNPFLGSSGTQYQAPASGSAADEEKALGIVAVWQSSAQYKQDCTLPAGSYIIEVPIYNTAGTTAFTKNLIGFVENGGTEHLATAKTYATGSWITEKIIFELANETAGYLSLGYTAANQGSAAMPHLFIDGVKVTYTSPIAAAFQRYQDALQAAQDAIGNSDYDNVTGDERTALQSAIDATPAQTKEAYNEAADALDSAREAFTGAKANYDAFVAAKATVVPDLAYAATAKKTTLEEAVAATASNSAEAATKAAAITTALRAYYESHALAEGVTEAVNYNSAVADANADTNTGWTDGIGTNQGQGYTDAAGNVAPKYLDGGWAGSTGVNIDMTRSVEIPAGKYLLTVTARGAASLDEYTLSIGGKTVDLPHNGGEGGVFGNGWDDVSVEFETDGSTQTLEVKATSTASQQWMSINRFRLVQLEANNDIALHKQAWEEAKTAAETARDNSDYENVTGSELTDLQNEIEKAEPSTADGYDEAAAALTTATATFTAAKEAYDGLAALWNNGVPELIYALTEKYTAIGDAYFGEGEVVNAADASARTAAMITAIRAYYESHAMAEKVEGAVDCADAIAGADPDTNTGWTGGIGTDSRDWEKYTDAAGNLSGKYYDGGWSTSAGVNITMSRSIEIPAGKYLLTVTARGSEALTSYTLSVGENAVDLPKNGSGVDQGVFGHGWDDVSLEFESDGHPVTLTIAATSTEYQQWISFNRFRLVRLELNNDVYAGATEYAALNGAIEAAEAKTLGFENSQYAPYNNVAALEALAAAKAINQTAELTNFKTDVAAATEALNDATWTANDGDMDAIYNGDFAIANGTNPQGWSRSNNGWGQQITGLTAEANGVADGTTTAWYYNTNGAWQYGNEGVYTMPLAENQSYELTFKYRRNGGDWQNWMKASVVNGDNEGLPVTEFAAAEGNTYFVTAKAYFTTSEAGNYTLSIEQNGNAHLTDVSLVKAESATLALNEGATFEPINRTFYEAIALTRKVVDGFNTVCLPFDLTADQVAVVFGENAKVYTYSENSEDPDKATINFNTKDDNTIEANVPVLIGEATASTDAKTFGDVMFNSSEAVVTGTNFDFVGTYAPMTVAENDYFIGNGAIYKSKGTTSMKAFRAYIKDKTNGQATVKLYIDGLETGIEAIDNGQMTMDNEVIYNVAGQRVNKAQKGIYIVNGKKVLVK